MLDLKIEYHILINGKRIGRLSRGREKYLLVLNNKYYLSKTIPPFSHLNIRFETISILFLSEFIEMEIEK